MQEIIHEIYIPNWEPTRLNKLLGSHFMVASRLKKADAKMISNYSQHVPKAINKRRIELVIEMAPKQRCADPDAHQKTIGDGLVRCRLLINDSHLWVEWMPTKFVRGKQKSTTIRIYDAE